LKDRARNSAQQEDQSRRQVHAVVNRIDVKNADQHRHAVIIGSGCGNKSKYLKGQKYDTENNRHCLNQFIFLVSQGIAYGSRRFTVASGKEGTKSSSGCLTQT
jgi:hypothetical protein